MVRLSVLITTVCLQLVSSTQSLLDDTDNELDIIPPADSDYNQNKNNNYVKIANPPVQVIYKNTGTHVELFCEAFGSPAPVIQWYKEHIKITENESFDENNYIIEHAPSIAKVSARLVINYALPRHQGTYYCVAENSVGQVARAKTSLIVNGREMNFTEMWAKKILGAFHHPRVTFWASQYMTVMGSDAVFPCKSVGNPQPTLTWYAPNGEQIVDNEHFKINQEGALSIRSVNWRDMGLFKCEVKNSMGYDSADTFLYPLREK